MTRTGFTPVHAAGDADLVRQARDGDVVAFADLYRRYARMVHGLLLARVPFDEVDDLVQEVFLSAWTPPVECSGRQGSIMHASIKRIVNPSPAPLGAYSPAVSAGGLIYVSGTLARDASGAVVGIRDVAAQTRRIIESAGELLSAAGSLSNMSSPSRCI